MNAIELEKTTIKFKTKLCLCGCGKEVNRKKHGSNKGEYYKYLQGHSSINFIGHKNPNWKGGKVKKGREEYVLVYDRQNPLAKKGYTYEHISVATKAFGKSLPGNAIIHHIDENRANNQNTNLVICQDSAYHNLLHQRMRSLKICGKASWRKCKYCKQYDDPEKLKIRKCSSAFHQSCFNEHWNKWNRARKKRKGVINKHDESI